MCHYRQVGFIASLRNEHSHDIVEKVRLQCVSIKVNQSLLLSMTKHVPFIALITCTVRPLLRWGVWSIVAHVQPMKIQAMVLV
jgi:hypothetical protein